MVGLTGRAPEVSLPRPDGAPTPVAEGADMHLIIVDDHPLFRDALSSAVRLAFPAAEVEEADGIESACAALSRGRSIDLTLLDLTMQGVNGFDGLIAIRTRFPRIPVLVVSGLDDPRIVREALSHGAAGFVPKAAGKPVLIRAITDVLNGAIFVPEGLSGPAEAPGRKTGKPPIAERIAELTPQQVRVLLMIRQGKLNKQIAHELGVGDSTVKAHVSEILRKLGVISRTQIVIETANLDYDNIMSTLPSN
ncbi:transcriptional regulator [Methylobacterium indicum]|uniref:DNA-binding response regulator n=2 Tax=Methylobacterium indicum TaxID=1775910 RepID=A0A0J6RWT4_9HYPH|nr:transcriptional regulator [Methylobacterium indicum]KMO25839.1 transcriptional regulator [Methylobacterium indicum]KTS37071.1 transcriptional regulator [Methylobacterium indicum]KTS42215.1 transcriptional regulator [Methylobacterium indicum]KTS47286.1 transcriptional regulator [Methylobacterium indicum]